VRSVLPKTLHSPNGQRLVGCTGDGRPNDRTICGLGLLAVVARFVLLSRWSWWERCSIRLASPQILSDVLKNSESVKHTLGCDIAAASQQAQQENLSALKVWSKEGDTITLS